MTTSIVAASGIACGDTITADTTLTADVVCPTGYNGVGLEIQASGVTLDGNGYRVIGGGGSSSKGVQVSGQANVVVKSIQLENFRIGIYAPNAPDLTVTDSTIEVNVVIGIQTGGTTDRLTLSGNVISTRLDALLIGGGSGHVWSNNYFESTGWYSHDNGVTNAIITDNIFDSPLGARAYGLYIYGNGNTITGNDFTGYYIGLWLGGGSNNIVSRNTIHDTGRRFGALYITSNTSGSKIYNNNFRNNFGTYINDRSAGRIGGSGSPNVFNLSKANGGGNWFDIFDQPGEGCNDGDSDGFCDSGYGPNSRVRNARDNFPLTQEVSPAPSDDTPPAISVDVSGALGNNGWYTSDVTVTWTVTDDESDVTTTGCETQNVTVDTSGVTYTCSAESAGGSASDSVTLKWDATAPTISGSASPAPNGNGWNNTNVTVSYTAADGLSGIDAGASDFGDDLLTAEDAGLSASGTVVDLAGNSASALVGGINIDKTAPVVTAPDGQVFPEDEPATYSPTATDNLSGIATLTSSPPSGSLQPIGVITVTHTAVDLADNSSSATHSVIITGACDCTESKGFWKKQFSGKGKKAQIDDPTLQTYLDVVNFASGVFSETVAAGTIAQAQQVLDPKNGSNRGGSGNGSNQSKDSGSGSGSGKKKKKKGDDKSGSGSGNKLDKKRRDATSQALAAWLNFAKGGITFDEAITIDQGSQSGSGSGNGAPAEVLSFEALIAEVEAILNNPNATKDDLNRAKDLAESVNQHDANNPLCGSNSGSDKNSKSGSRDSKSGSGS